MIILFFSLLAMTAIESMIVLSFVENKGQVYIGGSFQWSAEGLKWMYQLNGVNFCMGGD